MRAQAKRAGRAFARAYRSRDVSSYEGCGRDATFLETVNKRLVATSSSEQNLIGMQSPRGLLLVNITLFAIIFAATLITPKQVSALTMEQARERCRATIGRPIVQACMRSHGYGPGMGRMGRGGGNKEGDREACRARARPHVYACMQNALNAANGRAKVRVAIPEEESDETQDLTALPAGFVAPPRTIADITAILDQEKPDPAKRAKAEADASAEPPAGADRAKLKEFYFRRAQARASLGRLAEAIADCKQAVTHSSDYWKEGYVIEIYQERQMRLNGDYKEAIALLERAAQRLNISNAHKGNAFGIYQRIASNLLSLGEISRAEGYLKRNAALLSQARSWPNAQLYLSQWEALVESGGARLASLRGRFGEAAAGYNKVEALFRNALVMSQSWPQKFPSSLFESSIDFSALSAGMAKSSQGRHAEAEVDVRRALLSRLRSVGKYHIDTANVLNGFSFLLMEQGRVREANALARASMEILDTIGYRHDTNTYVSALLRHSAALFLQERYDEANQSYAAVDAATISWPPERRVGYRTPWARIFTHYYIGEVEKGIALAHQAYERSKVMMGEQHYGTAFARATVAAGLAIAEHDAEAMQEYAAALPALLNAPGEIDDEDATVRLYADRRLEMVLEAYIAVLARSNDPNRAEEGLRVVEAMRSRSVRNALSAFAARAAARTPALAEIVRKEQDLHKQVLAQATLLGDVLAEPPEERQESAVKYLRQDLEKLRKDRREARSEIQRRFPEYAALINPKPTSVAEVQALLGPNEALVLFLNTDESFKPIPDETYIWVITKGGLRWAKSELGTKALTERVAALRCGLDRTSWSDASSWPELTNRQKRQKASQIARRRRCLELLNREPAEEIIEVGTQNEKIAVLPFDLMRAHELYKGLLGPVEDMIKGKSLLIVPSGPLTSIPFNVLVTEPPEAGIPERLAQYRDVAWLGTRSAITVLPSVASLKALREYAKTSHATKPYLGIGNPLLDGAQGDPFLGDYYKELAELARTKRCSQMPTTPQQIASVPGVGSARDFVSTFVFRGAHADIESIRSQVPLPETADELCEIARRLGVPESDILLGANATESRLKDLSDQGRLADYAIVHFATHGTLTGQVKGLAEPGLILTPPPRGTSDPKGLERDDGYLTASEIATLKLDADWVVLSACNTAGPQDEGAEALSGLARAFFYAGARALLVSHWAVGSDAAVKLTTRAFAELKARPEIGRAEALRISMKELIEKGDLADAHPREWAPFVIVGEGATSR